MYANSGPARPSLAISLGGLLARTRSVAVGLLTAFTLLVGMGTVSMASAAAGTEPWDKEFTLSNNDSSTNGITQEAGKSTNQVAQVLRGPVLAIIAVVIVIAGGIALAVGGWKIAGYTVLATMLIVFLLGVAGKFIFAEAPTST